MHADVDGFGDQVLIGPFAILCESPCPEAQRRKGQHRASRGLFSGSKGGSCAPHKKNAENVRDQAASPSRRFPRLGCSRAFGLRNHQKATPRSDSECGAHWHCLQPLSVNALRVHRTPGPSSHSRAWAPRRGGRASSAPANASGMIPPCLGPHRSTANADGHASTPAGAAYLRQRTPAPVAHSLLRAPDPHEIGPTVVPYGRSPRSRGKSLATSHRNIVGRCR